MSDAESFFNEEAVQVQIRELERKLGKSRAVARQARADLKWYQQALEESETVRDLALAIDTEAGARPMPEIKLGGKRGGATAVALLSDIHVGAKVTRAETDGRNEFNPDICLRRLQEWAKALVWAINDQWRNVYDVESLFIGNIGDILEGMIHEELKSHNTMTPIREVQWWVDNFPPVLRWIADALDMPITLYQCDGNHGRNTKKLFAAGRADWSLTHLAFHSIAKMFEPDPRITVLTSTGHRDYVDVYHWTLRLEHGDSFRYAGGVGGLAIPFNKYVYRLNQTRHADHTMVGHWHDCQRVGANVVNGTVKGVDAFTEKLGFVYQPPTQWLGLISERWGLKTEERLILDTDERRAT